MVCVATTWHSWEKRNLAALTTIKNSRALAEKLLSQDPSYYDAYLAIGVENYLLIVNSAPVRWILRLTGARTDKEEGLAKLRLTAQRGRYLAPLRPLAVGGSGAAGPRPRPSPILT